MKGGSGSMDSKQDAASRFLLELYRGARSVSVSDFRKWALELLNRFVVFDSALWGMGYLADEIVVTAFTLHNQPMEMMVNYERFKDADFLVNHLACAPGTAIDLFDVVSQETFRKSEIYKRHARIYGMEQNMAIFIPDPLTRLFNALSFYRADPGAYFAPGDKAFVQFVAPHFVEAATLNYFHDLLLKGEHGGCSVIVSDREGLLHQIEVPVAELLQREWPDWQGPGLPGILRKKVQDEDFTTHQGERIRVDFQPRGEWCHLLLRELGPFDRLTTRERQIAEQLARGRRYKEVSEEMGLSPSTITNHANRIYRKLGVRSKAELAQMQRKSTA